MTTAVALLSDEVVAGTSRRQQLDGIRQREVRLAPILLQTFERWRNVFTDEAWKRWARMRTIDEAFAYSPLEAELRRRVPELEAALTRELVRRATPADDFLSPLGPLTPATLARAQVGDLVRELRPRQLAALRTALVTLMADGPSREVLASIRESVGLTSRQVTAVQNLRRKLVAEGVPGVTAASRARVYAGRLRTQRARLIARTEATRFTSALVEARASQVGGSFTKSWVSARDGNVDAGNPGGPCVQLDNGARVPTGGVFTYGGGEIARPPAHPGCRCVLEIHKTKPKQSRRRPTTRRRVTTPRVPTPRPAPKPPPPPAPATPVGEARPAAQVGKELEAIDKRFAGKVAKLEEDRASLGRDVLSVQHGGTFQENVKLQAIEGRLRRARARELGRDPVIVGPDFEATVASLNANSPEYRRVVAQLAENKRLDTIAERQLKAIAVKKEANSAKAESVRLSKERRQLKILERPKELQSDATLTVQSGHEHSANWRKGVARFRRLVHRRYTISSRVSEGPDVRSYHTQGRVRMGSGNSDTVVHEIGHALEYFDNKVLEASARFLSRRTAGESSRKLRLLFPEEGYRIDEIARPDAFPHPYSGKIYDWDVNIGSLVHRAELADGTAIKASEVVSMGLEYMSRDALKFWRRDPDYFTYIWDIMRGIIPGG